MSIRSKLILITTTLGLLPVAVVIVVSLLILNNHLVADSNDNLRSGIERRKNLIETILRTRQEQATSIANKYSLQKAISDFRATSSEADRQTIYNALKDQKLDNTDIDSVYLFQNDGQLITTTDDSLQAKPFSLSNDFTSPLETDANSLWVWIGENDSVERLTVATRVVEGGTAGALLAVNYRTDDVLAVLQDYSGLGSTGEVLIVAKDKDNNARVLFPLRFANNSALNLDLNSMGLIDGPRDEARPATDYRGKTVTVIVKDATVAAWQLVIKVDNSQIFTVATQLQGSMTAMVGVLLAVVIVTSILFARRFTSPLLELTQKTRSIILGDFSQTIKTNRRDEIGQLASSFNSMTYQLANSYRALEKKVAQRTHELKHRVHQLQEGKAKDDAILSSISYGMVITDVSSKILQVNEAACSVIGFEQKDLVGRRMVDIDFRDDKHHRVSDEERPVIAALRQGTATTKVLERIRPDGSRIFLSMTASPIVEGGDIIGVLTTLHDVTRERLVDKMKTEFISLASHQLRTPLSAIKWFSEMLLAGDAGKLKKEQLELTQNVYESTKRMVALVNALLNVSRLESGRVIVKPEPTDLKQLVNIVTTEVKAEIVKRKQKLTVEIDKSIPVINLDPRLIEQVYLNLLTNAAKYTPNGGHISVKLYIEKSMVISRISDNGYGIPQAEQSKIFEKFFRATNIVKVETNGNGLGMYLVHALVKLARGRIWFESHEGKGTTFWFTLPLSGMKEKSGEVTLDT